MLKHKQYTMSFLHMFDKTYDNIYIYIYIYIYTYIHIYIDTYTGKIVKYKMKNWNILNEILMTFLQCFLYMYM